MQTGRNQPTIVDEDVVRRLAQPGGREEAYVPVLEQDVLAACAVVAL